mmetsp:Transcript_881/g.1770  ORF Transcript_881/g.1770 Transcript_881/m.1770 type:complete len:175 (+) Transcript_881:60-584(+)
MSMLSRTSSFNDFLDLGDLVNSDNARPFTLPKFSHAMAISPVRQPHFPKFCRAPEYVRADALRQVGKRDKMVLHAIRDEIMGRNPAIKRCSSSPSRLDRQTATRYAMEAARRVGQMDPQTCQDGRRSPSSFYSSSSGFRTGTPLRAPDNLSGSRCTWQNHWADSTPLSGKVMAW